MARECCFCPSTANITGEHIWSDWMNKLFSPAKLTFHKIEDDGSASKPWFAPDLNLKANVVCDKCNSTWMSELESFHAKPAMSNLILGKTVNAITYPQAHSISLFAFKTAIITNRCLSDDEWFFDVSERYAFRQTQSLPPERHDVAHWNRHKRRCRRRGS